MKKLAVIGSTGSIGQNTYVLLRICRSVSRFFSLAASSSVDLLAEQTAAFRPSVVGITDRSRVDEFRKRCRELNVPLPEVVAGQEGLRQIVSADDVDIVVSAAVGAAGLGPTYSAVAAGKTVALANKEAMVLAGELLRQTAEKSGAKDHTDRQRTQRYRPVPPFRSAWRSQTPDSDGIGRSLSRDSGRRVCQAHA